MVRTLPFLTLLLSAVFAGCANRSTSDVSPPPSHPANPDAKTAENHAPPNVLGTEYEPAPLPEKAAQGHEGHSTRGEKATTSTKVGGDNYPLDTCVVSGEKLGSMGSPVVIQYKGQEVRFCCKRCVPEFEKDPTRYLENLKAAAEKANSSTPEAGPEHHEHN